MRAGWARKPDPKKVNLRQLEDMPVWRPYMTK